MMTGCRKGGALIGVVVVALAILLGPGLLAGGKAWAQTEGRIVEESTPLAGNVPGGHLGTSSDAEIWRAVRRGLQGQVSIPNRGAGILIQSEGDNWRAWRNGPLTVIGVWIIFGAIGLLALFFVARGRVMIDAGPSGRTMERFNGVERFTHWMTAVSFVLLALTGLNLLYGRHVLLPAMGPEAFGVVALAGKYVHNFVAFSFMIGILLMVVLWVRHNIPNKDDLIWLSKGGGLFAKGVHPPSWKFNAGQKIVFWAVILGGISMSLSGISLLFPFEFSMFSWTFEVMNVFGFDLPTDLAPVHEMQLSQLWHGAVGLIMIGIILAHIYIGSLGMEGAFDAMGTGQVDENWAREHHNMWVAEVKGEAAPETDAGSQPAE